MKTREQEHADALAAEPEGAKCGWCGADNDFFDDNGWFWACPEEKDQRPCCRACWDGGIGKQHEARWGVGDR